MQLLFDWGTLTFTTCSIIYLSVFTLSLGTTRCKSFTSGTPKKNFSYLTSNLLDKYTQYDSYILNVIFRRLKEYDYIVHLHSKKQRSPNRSQSILGNISRTLINPDCITTNRNDLYFKWTSSYLWHARSIVFASSQRTYPSYEIILLSSCFSSPLHPLTLGTFLYSSAYFASYTQCKAFDIHRFSEKSWQGSPMV